MFTQYLVNVNRILRSLGLRNILKFKFMKRLLQSLFVMMFFAVSAIAQERTISGTVKGEGATLPGVTVSVKGFKENGTTTNSQGTFTIKVPSNATLVFSYVGFLPKEVAVGPASSIAVTLAVDSKSLAEVTVVSTGYTSVNRTKSPGAISTVKAKEIEGIPNASLDQILQGRAPGLYVTAGSGQPGSNSTSVTIRGVGSINGSTTPLYVVDGVQIESGVFSTMNPDDFESVNVLKDASSTSLYGSKGANGVIVITTKRGKAGTTVFNYRSQYGITTRTQPNFDMMNSGQLLDFQKLAQTGPGWYLDPASPDYAGYSTSDKVQATRDLDSLRNTNTRWDDLFFKKGHFQSQEVTASGGNENTHFFTSASYYKQDGTIERSNIERYNFRTNLDHTSGKFSYGINTAVGFSKSNFIESEAAIALANPFAAAYLALPYENPFRADGTINTSTDGQYDSRIGSRALARIDGTSNLENQFKGILAANVAYKITDYLKATSVLGLDFRETNSEHSTYPGSYAAASGSALTKEGSFYQENERNFNITSTSGLTFNKIYNQKHDVEVNGFFEITQNRYRDFFYTGYGINPKLLNTPAGITPGTVANGFIPSVGGSRTQNAYVSEMVIGRYTYSDKYTLTGSIRRDGTSKLPEVNREKFFYSVGAAWNAMKEDFMSSQTVLSQLRLRGSKGTSANGTAANNFDYVATFTPVTYAGSTSSGIAANNPGNANYNWEYTNNTDFGLDFGLFKDRITGTVELYEKKTKGLLLDQRLSLTTGFASQPINAGSMRNRGIEVNMSGDIIRTNDFNWTLSFNFGYNKNKITDLGQASEYPLGTSIVKVGLPYGTHYAVKWAGVDPATGDAQYYDLDGNKTTEYSTAYNTTGFGTYIPPFTGGFGTSLRYKGFDASAFFSFAQGYKRFNNEIYFLKQTAFAGNYNQVTEMSTIWQKPGDITDIPRADVQRQFNSSDIQDASFIRLRNANIGYNFSPDLLRRSKIVKGLRVYVQGQNLLTWTKWQGFDPEDNDNLAAFEYPSSRTYTVGLNVTL
jgi:TonB-linked SusC/RagA family outer membrane protein